MRALLHVAAASLAVACLALACAGAPARAQAYWAEGTWEGYRAKFVSDDGRVIDDANKDISHSEGQGYGMLLAVYADDPATFAKLWRWTSRELYIRGDDLAAWRWEPGKSPHVADPNNATDGDLLVAWALGLAGERWSMPALLASGRKIALSAGRRATFRSSHGLMLRPGLAGFDTLDGEDGPVVNLSYWVFPAFETLQKLAPEIDWAGLGKSGLALAKAARFGPAKLPSDWISLRQKDPRPAEKFPAQFAYNALRVPLYLVWGGHGEKAQLAPYADLWRGMGPGGPATIDIASGKPVEAFKDEGYRLVPALVQCALAGTRIPEELRNVKFEHYYSSTIQMLSLVAARQRQKSCL